MTLATAGQCSEATARALTDQLRQSLAVSWELLVEAYQRRAWAALGYETWDAYTDAELGEVRLRLPREERREVVASMADAGMSNRAIGSALGVDEKLVRIDRRSGAEKSAPADEPIDAELVEDDSPEAMERAVKAAILGTDGKTYTAPPQPAQPRRRPLPESFWQAAYDLNKVTERIERLAEDDRFPQNAGEVAARNRNDLIRAIDALQGVVNRLPSA